jgi:hypothetical protein
MRGHLQAEEKLLGLNVFQNTNIADKFAVLHSITWKSWPCIVFAWGSTLRRKED